jgi:malonyl-CoA decarboxylase
MTRDELALVQIMSASPTVVLERLIAGEAVHAIRSWRDLERRLATDRRCYALVHPNRPLEPLVFTEVALTAQLPDNVQTLLDEGAPTLDVTRARLAVFYSISNTRPELRGSQLGFDLLRRAIGALDRELPHLEQFSTLSPVPTFSRWLAEWFDADDLAPLRADMLAPMAVRLHEPPGKRALKRILTTLDWPTDALLVDALREPMTRLAAHFVLVVKRDGRPADPVARFHLGNGARIERLNWLADTSRNGLNHSCSLMVNYRYDPGAVDRNKRRYLTDGIVDASDNVRALATHLPEAGGTTFVPLGA